MPKALSFEVDITWNSTSVNTSMQTIKPLAAAPGPIYSTSVIHQVVIDKDKKTLFTPDQLSASIGDIIVFTPVDLGDTVAQATLDWPCQAQVVLSAVNFSRLMYPYLVTTQNPAWFYSSSHQQDCALGGSDQRTFSLNPSDRHLVNVSTTSSGIPTASTSSSEAPGMVWTGYGGSTGLALTATPSLGTWPMNFSIWATGAPSATAQPSRISFPGRASAKEVSRGMIYFFLSYCYVIGIL